MVQGDRFLGIVMGCGFSLVAELQEWSRLVRLLVYPLKQWHQEQPPVQAEHECRRHSSVYGGFWKFFVLLLLQCACAVRTWKSVHYFLLASYFAVLCLVFGCCFWSTGNWFLWEMLWGAMLGLTVETSFV